MYSIRAGFEIEKALLGITGCAGGDIKGTPTTPPGTCEEHPYYFPETKEACPTGLDFAIKYDNTDTEYPDGTYGETILDIYVQTGPDGSFNSSISGVLSGIDLSKLSGLFSFDIYNNPDTTSTDGRNFCVTDVETMEDTGIEDSADTSEPSDITYYNDQIIFDASVAGIHYFIGVKLNTDYDYNPTVISLYMAKELELDGNINNLWDHPDVAGLTTDDITITCD